MPELQIDVTVANRFISSLSKSLQALCHGCMDFDNGIEIVGYINVNIDSGNKVDYVLNEKVLKSTTNSMTFVSNSFLAKKEQQKQTREGCCSPIPQTQAPTSYPPRMRGAPLSSQYHRTASQYSTHSQIPGGSQKRSRADDWRLSPKRHRIQNPSTETQSFTDQNSMQTASSTLSSTGNAYLDSNFKQPHVPASAGSVDNTLLLQMNIKKEVLETDNHGAVDTENMPSEDQSDEQTYDSSSEVDKIQIKSDPDAAKLDSGETTPTDTDISKTVAKENTDFKGTFLEPSSPNDTLPTEEGNSQSESDNQLSAFEQSSRSASTKEQILTDESNVASTSAVNLGDNGSGVSVDNEATSDVPIEYDQAAEDSSYSQSAYEDAGEGSSDPGQFEVIEIDDEDEDVQGLFGDARIMVPRGLRQQSCQNGLVTSRQAADSRRTSAGSGHFRGSSAFTSVEFQEQMSLYSQKSLGPDILANAREYMKAQLSQFQGHITPFTCSLCGKSYVSHSGLSRHMLLHEGKTYMCPICDAKFTQKSSMKTHLKGIHKSSQCAQCSAILLMGPEFNEHVLHCK